MGEVRVCLPARPCVAPVPPPPSSLIRTAAGDARAIRVEADTVKHRRRPLQKRHLGGGEGGGELRGS